MLDRLKSIEERYEKLNELLSDPEVVNDPKKLREYSKEQSDIQETVDVYRQYRDASEQLADAKAMLEEKLDAEMRDMVKEEISELQKETETLSERLKVLLIPKDPNDDKNVIMEIRGAAGGEEAALFAGNLYRMYSRYAELQGWKTEVMEANVTGTGGYKDHLYDYRKRRVF